MSDLTERRAWFVYDAARLAAQFANAPIVPVPWAEREAAFRSQFCDVIEQQMGEQRSGSPEELHGSWMQAYFAMGWMYGPVYDREAKRHPDLVPYADLGQLERDKDAVFVALCEIARQWIGVSGYRHREHRPAGHPMTPDNAPRLTPETIDWGHERHCPCCDGRVQWHDGEESWKSCPNCDLPVGHFAIYDKVAALQLRVEAAERLVTVAIVILGGSSPGSYWIHWRLAAEQFLRWPRRRGLFYDESGNAIGDDATRALLNSLGDYDLLHRESRIAAFGEEV